MPSEVEVGNLVVGMQVRLDELKSNLSKAERELRDFRKKLPQPESIGRKLGRGISDAARHLMGFAKIGLSVVSLALIPIVGIARKVFGVISAVFSKIVRIAGDTIGFMVNKFKWGLLAIGAAFVGISYVGSQFEFGMKKVFARLGGESSLLGNQITILTKKAKELGRTTLFTARESSEGMEILARAGFSVNEITTLIGPTLKAAQANAMGLANTADIASTIFRAFTGKVDSLETALDMVTYTANSSLNTFEDLGVAYSYIGQVTGPLKTSFAEITAALGILGNVGLKGSRAGTALRRVLLKLNDLSGPAARFLNELGLAEEDVSTKTYTLAQIIDKLNKAGLDAADTTQLVGIRGGPALSALLTQGGDAVRDFANEIADTSRYVDILQKDMQRGLIPQLKLLKSAVESAAASLYEKYGPALTRIVEKIKNGAEQVAKTLEEDTRVANILDKIVEGLEETGNQALKIGKNLGIGFVASLNASADKYIALFERFGVGVEGLSESITPESAAGFFDKIHRVVIRIGTEVANIMEDIKVENILQVLKDLLEGMRSFGGYLLSDVIPTAMAFMDAFAKKFIGALGWADRKKAWLAAGITNVGRPIATAGAWGASLLGSFFGIRSTGLLGAGKMSAEESKSALISAMRAANKDAGKVWRDAGKENAARYRNPTLDAYNALSEELGGDVVSAALTRAQNFFLEPRGGGVLKRTGNLVSDITDIVQSPARNIPIPPSTEEILEEQRNAYRKLKRFMYNILPHEEFTIPELLRINAEMIESYKNIIHIHRDMIGIYRNDTEQLKEIYDEFKFANERIEILEAERKFLRWKEEEAKLKSISIKQNSDAQTPLGIRGK